MAVRLKGKLIHDAGSETFELGEVSSIGRSPDSAVPVAEPRASRRHALIRRQHDGFWFFDLGSCNGSYLNGRRVTTGQLLKDGDRITIGDHHFRFESGNPAGSGSSGTHSSQTLIGVQAENAIILVSDIQGFTALSEHFSPDQLAPIVGSWYAAIGRVLDTHGATLDKFIGDCVLAYWLNTSIPVRLAAIHAALTMQQVAESVRRDHQEILSRTGMVFRAGTAIHLGPVACGAISAGEFTLLGDAVNLAFRLESLTREYDKLVLVSGEFLASWDAGRNFCEACGSRLVKGRNEPVEVFAVERAPA